MKKKAILSLLILVLTFGSTIMIYGKSEEGKHTQNGYTVYGHISISHIFIPDWSVASTYGNDLDENYVGLTTYYRNKVTGTARKTTTEGETALVTINASASSADSMHSIKVNNVPKVSLKLTTK